MSKFTKSVTIRFTQEDSRDLEEVMKDKNIFKISELVRTLVREENQRQGERQ